MPARGDFFASHAGWRGAAVTSQSPKRVMGADRRAEEREPPLGSDPIPKQEDGAGLAMDIMSRTSAALCPFSKVPQPKPASNLNILAIDQVAPSFFDLRLGCPF